MTESTPDPVPDSRIIERGRDVLRIESESVASLVGRLGESFSEAVRQIASIGGRVVVTGIGKSGIVARKLASTFSSTGTPAIFLHPVEAAHGDVGMLVNGDLVLALSKSGESSELESLMPVISRLGIPVIALTSEPDSSLARRADLVLDVSVQVEACPHDLAPTASSTAALAMGDALAMAVSELRGFGPEDFARLHPGGDLGRRLTWTVRDVMITDPDRVPALGAEANLGAAMHEIAHRQGTVPIVDGDSRVVGVITAGDLTRYADGRDDFLTHPVSAAMNAKPKTIGPEELATKALELIQRHGIMAVPVVDADDHLVGMLHLHDLLRARLT
ncbi:MAG: KpsF/GutQ family sugar-phosphate isomerase [marine benthic group bacterium]|nr:KpsF/GutQ family sugar-phosphate isomerase [Candidatus Benthicola marisminoris]